MFNRYHVGWFRPARVVPEPVAVQHLPVQDQLPAAPDQQHPARDQHMRAPDDHPPAPAEVDDDANDAAEQEELLNLMDERNNLQENNNNSINNNNYRADAADVALPAERQQAAVSPSLLTLSWTFLTTFFTSLIPEQPQLL